MTLYIVLGVILGVLWLGYTGWCLLTWDEVRSRPVEPKKDAWGDPKTTPYSDQDTAKAAKRLMVAVTGVLLLPIWPLALAAGFIYAVIWIYRAARSDIKAGRQPTVEDNA